jgi:hypothetical protein
MGRHARHRAGHANSEAPQSVTATGTHRAVGRRRGVAAWPIACLVLIGLLVAGWFGWNWADGVLESRAAAEVASCPQGDATVRVAVDPALEEPVATAADRWNREGTIVREHCVRVDVHAVPSEEVEAVLLDSAEPASIGGYPTAWLPDAAERIDRLAADRPELIGSSGLTIASSTEGEHRFLAVAGPHTGEVEQHAAQSFQKFLLRPAQQDVFRAAGLTPANA